MTGGTRPSRAAVGNAVNNVVTAQSSNASDWVAKQASVNNSDVSHSTVHGELAVQNHQSAQNVVSNGSTALTSYVSVGVRQTISPATDANGISQNDAKTSANLLLERNQINASFVVQQASNQITSAATLPTRRWTLPSTKAKFRFTLPKLAGAGGVAAGAAGTN